VHALIDSGASENFMNLSIVDELKLPIYGSSKISMASITCSIQSLCQVYASLAAFKWNYVLEFGAMPHLCSDIILDHPFLQKLSKVSFVMGKPEALIKILKNRIV